jgi:hypothetical protein
MAKVATVPADGTVLVGLTDPPTIPVTCQVYDAVYDAAHSYVSSPVQAGHNGLLVWQGDSGGSLTLFWLPDAGATNSLSDFLEDNAGATIYVSVQSIPGAVTYTYTCQAVPGGDRIGRAGTVLTTSSRLPVSARVKS